MTLTIELTAQEETPVTRAAHRKRVPPMQFVKELDANIVLAAQALTFGFEN